MAVFVLDRHSRPLMPCSEKRARLLLERRRARVHRLMPFTIRLTDRRLNDCELQGRHGQGNRSDRQEERDVFGPGRH